MCTVNAIRNSTLQALRIDKEHRACRLEADGDVWLFCGPGPTDGTAAYLNSDSGDMVVLFVCQLRCVASTTGFFEPENTAIASVSRTSAIGVRWKHVHGVVSVGASALVGPVVLNGRGFLEGVAAVPL